MPTKFLDLDAINKPLGHFKLQGTDYDVYPLSLKGMINLSTLPTSFDEADPAAGGQQLTQALDVLAEIVPDCPRATLEGLSMPQLNALMEWANNLGEDQVSKNSAPPTRRPTARLTSPA